MISNYGFINHTHEKKLKGCQGTTHSNINYNKPTKRVEKDPFWYEENRKDCCEVCKDIC